MPDPQNPVVVVPYDPLWVVLFETECEAIQERFAGLPAEFHHIGSTSVPGLAAKPIVDVMIVVESADDAMRTITPIVQLGYTCFGEFGIPGRIYFHRHTYNPFHIHLYVRGNPEADRHRFFRVYLRKYSDILSQQSNTDQQISFRKRWSSSTSTRIPFGSCLRCH